MSMMNSKRTHVRLDDLRARASIRREKAGRARRRIAVKSRMVIGLVFALGGLVAVVSVASASSRAGVGWVRAEDYANKSGQPALYWPGNLLDGNNSTVWCVDGGARGARRQGMRIGFKGSVHADKVTVVTGDARSENQFSSNNRVTRIVLNDGRYRRTVNLSDKRDRQEIQLSPPIRGHYVDLTIGAVAGSSNLTCMTGIIFHNADGRALNGSWMAGNLKYDRTLSPLLGVWAGGQLAAPERFLTLFVDGTYRYLYNPHDPASEPFDRRGSYRVSAGRLQLQMGGQWQSIRFNHVTGRDEFGEPYVRLELSDAPGPLEDMEGTWHEWRN